VERFAVQDMTSVLSGSRRLGADIAFIQLLLYYGTMENAHEGHNHPKEHAEDAHPGHTHWDAEINADIQNDPLPLFPQLKNLGLRVGLLDPYFHYAFLFTGGALGFNLNRMEDAIDVLRRGAEADPHFPRYALYAGALAYKRSEGQDKVIPWLEEAIKDPDCPTMIKNILANMYRQEGNLRRAAEIFINIVETSRDKEYVALAIRKLQDIQKQITPPAR
jgi:tetratricopeptide (TPR) repeat protein